MSIIFTDVIPKSVKRAYFVQKYPKKSYKIDLSKESLSYRNIILQGNGN